MRKNRLLPIIIIFSWFFVFHAKATDYTLDDSCTDTVSIMNRIVDDITTLGLFEAYSEDFHLFGANGYDGSGSEDAVNGCLADYYPDDCNYSANEVTGGGDSSCSGSAYVHNDSYCQQDGTNCCDDALTCTTDSSGNENCYPTYDSYIGVACPTSGVKYDCNPDGGMQFCYDNYDWETLTYQCNGNGDAIWAQDGDSAWFFYPSGEMRIAKDGDKICAQFATTLGYQNIGCKYIPSCTQFYLNQQCYVAESCYNFKSQNSMAMLPITSSIVQCINDSIQFLFYGNPNCNETNNASGEYEVTSFSGFQQGMRSTVRSALMLYVVLLGIKMVLSHELQSKGEFFRMGAKFTLVLYFSTGININGVIGTDGQPYYDDGIHNYMIPLFINGSQELSQWVYSAGGNQGLCVYDTDLYPSGYSYLSIWDGIDCRLLYYFGVDLAAMDIESTNANSTTLSLGDFEQPVLMTLLLPALFAFQIIFLFCSILFGIMFLSVMIYFVNVTITSAILLGILVYIAPVFVPMALFKPTEGYYESWLKLAITYALQPMVVSAYIAMMLTLFDQTMFGDCVFQNSSVIFDSGTQSKENVPFFMLCDPHDAEGDCYNCPNDGCDYYTTSDISGENITQCSETIGYYLNPISSDSDYTSTVDAVFFDLQVLNSNLSNSMMIGLVTLCLFGFIFYKFADVIDEFAQELTGGNLGGAAGKPMALVNKAGKAAKDMMKYATRKKDKDSSGAKSSSSDSKKRSGANSSSSNTPRGSGASSSSSR